MNISTATPLPVSTFDNAKADESPEGFLNFLRGLIAENLDGDPSKHIPAANKDHWVTVVNGLSGGFLASFPLPNVTQWDEIHERVALTETTLEVVLRVSNRVAGIFLGSEDLVVKLYTRLLSLWNDLEMWVDVEVPQIANLSTPAFLKEKAVHVTVEILRSLGGGIITAAEPQQPMWKSLRTIIIASLEVIHDLICPSAPLTFPLTISLFNKFRLHGAQQDDVSEPASLDTPLDITITMASQLPPFLGLLVEILTKAVCPALFCQWFLTDLVRRISGAAQRVFDFCLSSSCSTTSEKRARTLMTIISCTIPFCKQSIGIEGPLLTLPYRLLRFRLDNGPKPGWDAIDLTLSKTFNASLGVSCTRGNVITILETLRHDKWGEAGRNLRVLAISYLRSCLSLLDLEQLQAIKEALSSIDYGPPVVAFEDEVEDCLAKLSSGSKSDVNVPAQDSQVMEVSTWKQRVQDLVQDIIEPDQITWMDDDKGLNDHEFAKRALQDISGRFSRPLAAKSIQARMSLAEQLVTLPCLVAFCNRSASVCKTQKQTFSAISAYIPVVTQLLDGPEDEVTTSVRRKTYNILTRVLEHHDLSFGHNGLEHVMNIVYSGIANADRNVRLCSGNSLSAIVRLCATGPDALKWTEPIFANIYRQFDTAKSHVGESLIIAVGSMGKTSNVDVLGQVIALLIAQLGRQNPILKGVAYMQLLALTKYHKKSPYLLFLPYMDQIAPYIISRMCIQPSLLIESCRLMCLATADFISTTLPRTLPQLFATCEMKVLEAIGKISNEKLSALLIEHSHEILAHVFLLQGPGQTSKALNFIVKVLTDATQSSSIDVKSVVKSCIVPLLAELVIVMGDENVDTQNAALTALKKVERALVVVPSKGRVLPPPDLGAFLKTYMLGLISDINDMLQDVYGKKSVTAKRKILRSLGALITRIGPAVSNVAPQIMATFQTMLSIPELAEVTLESWHQFLSTLGPTEIGPHVGPTSAAFISSWSNFSPHARELAAKSLSYIIVDVGNHLGRSLDDVVDFSAISELNDITQCLKTLRGAWTPKERLQRILERSSSDNLTVAVQSLGELETFMMTEHQELIAELTSGDMFDPIVGQILAALFAAACRDGDGADSLRLLAFECIGVLGAVDPDRCEIGFNDPRMIMLGNFRDERESVDFALHLIRDLLVGAFRSTSDIKYQGHLAYSIQELLRFCQFTPSLVAAGNTSSVPLRVRNRWNSLPKHVLETVTPLLEARFTLNLISTPDLQHPIYRHQSTYREWIQLWVTHLITKASGPTAQIIFGVFRSPVRNKDVVVAHHLLPHLVLNILISGHEDDAQAIRSEILEVLEDQVSNDSGSTADKKLLSAQAVFMLLDHLNKWVRIVRQDTSTKKNESKRARANQISNQAEEQLLRVDSILSSIDQNLMAKAALECKAYARSLMNFEQQVVTLRERSPQNNDLPGYYERLHEIYSHLDEPDGMEGISTLILSPSLEHQIRQHESTGRWTSAQSCWEVRLQESPDNVDFHLGLLRCLRNLGHYDTLRTHVRGVLTRNPDWESALAGFQIESAWMVGAWEDVQNMVDRTSAQTSPIAMGRLLLAMRTGDSSAITASISAARSILGAPITAAGGYRRSYEAVLDLHMTHELEVIHGALAALPVGTQGNSLLRRRQVLAQLSRTLAGRLDATLPTFRTREPVLSMRRTAFTLSSLPRHALAGEIGRSWLASAKIARKAGQWQTAYSAMLQAQQSKTRFSFMESAKLVKSIGEPLRALQELENSMRLLGLLDEAPNVLDLTVDDEEMKIIKAKAQVIRARWMNESDRFEMNSIFLTFQNATTLRPNWESSHYHLGQFHDECFKILSPAEQVNRGMKMNLYTVRAFTKALKYGSKYVYQTVPRLLTIWLDMGEDRNLAQSDIFKKLNEVAAKAIKEAPVYKWFTAFPQIVSRVGHANPEVYKHLSKLIVKVMEEYPKQALWLFTSVVKSTKSNREQRGKQILDQLRNNPNNAGNQVSKLILQCVSMTNELLALCDYYIDDDSKKTLTMSKDFPKLSRLGKSQLIIPLQESLTASLPPTSSSESIHQPFPPNAPTFEEFHDEIEIMRSLAKPRKITIRGSNGQIYMFLGKPKDDLRKDARLMDFNAIINKLLKANSESRRRQLHIRTYGVVTLNEECGFIQWVPNTIPIRPVLIKGYDARRIRSWTSEMNDIFKKIKDSTDKEAGGIFVKKVLPAYPPVFHDWFIETFPEPTAWLASRLAYGRTAAVMSMVGFILGLGDRHCENILLDANTGDVVHVDFNCLFEKGKTLETPERVPFRLTQNIIDGLGVTGVEGVFRIACEVTMQLLRDNKDSLMSVLDAFIHDPLVEWEDEKRKLEREPSRRNQVKASVDLRMLAKGALNPIEKKLKGIYSTSKERQEKEISTSNLVQMLIQEATDPTNLAKMYPGWASWH